MDDESKQLLRQLVDAQREQTELLRKHVLPLWTHCNRVYYRHEEKITDVGIATEMLTDAFSNDFDIATLVSADSDLVPVVKRVRQRFPEKDVLIGFPPGRGCKELKQVASNWFYVSRDSLSKCQFPNLVPTPRGFAVVRPSEWA